LALGFTSALMLRRLSLSFFSVPVALVAFGILFHHFGSITLFNAAAFALPVLLSFALGERVAYARRPVKSRQVGYVYGGSYLPDQDHALAKAMIPAKEDVPERDFATRNPHIGTKPNGRFGHETLLPHFSAQDQSGRAAKPASTPSPVR
jgi:hypothetical protein